jgi:predicted transglutaminase-like cysteine proteinase
MGHVLTVVVRRFASRALPALLAFGYGIVLLAISNEIFPLERVMQSAQQRYGGHAAAIVKDWSKVLELFRPEPEEQQLRDVNEYVNGKLRFEDDIKVWGRVDYWATPIEALIKGAGDCEDYAIAKYFSLKMLGVPVAKLRMTYVRAKLGGSASNVTQAHMVLTYYSSPNAEPLILDNLISEIRLAGRRPDLTPIFSFNSEGIFDSAGMKPQPGGGSRLSKWNDVVEKMKAEGFE